MKKWLLAGLSFGIATVVTRMLASEKQRRQHAADLKEQVQRWEDEGGQVPGGTIGAPATKPTADHPQSYSATT